MESIVSQIWAGWFVNVQQAISPLVIAFGVSPRVKTPPLRVDLLDDQAKASQPWSLSYFQPVVLALNACFGASALTDRMSPAPLATQMLYESLSNPGQFDERSLRLPWIGWYQKIHDAVVELDTAAMVPVTIIPPPFSAVILIQPRETPRPQKKQQTPSDKPKTQEYQWSSPREPR